MTRDDIIKMAKEAGAYAPKYPIGPHDVQFSVASLEHFFRMAQEAEADRITNESKHIIKRAEARGAAAEREACAEMVWPTQQIKVWSDKEINAMTGAFNRAQEKHGWYETLMAVGAAALKNRAAAIRARSNQCG